MANIYKFLLGIVFFGFNDLTEKINMRADHSKWTTPNRAPIYLLQLILITFNEIVHFVLLYTKNNNKCVVYT